MGSGAIKWHVHCSVCGAFIEKSAQSDSEVECKKCRSTLENELSVVSVGFGRNHQERTRQQEFVKELNLTGITKSPAKHLRIHCKIRSIFWFWRLLKYLFCRAFLTYFEKILNFFVVPHCKTGSQRFVI